MWSTTPHFHPKRGIRLIKSLVHASQLLECFDAEHKELGIVELARMTGMNKSTVHHLVATLCATGFLDRSENRHYRLSLHILTLGSRVMDRLDVSSVADPVLRVLQKRLQETVHLAICEHLNAVYLIKLDPERPLRMVSQVGRSVPLHASAVGKVLLAYHHDLVAAIIARGLQAYTPRTITSGDQLVQQLQDVRRNGYAMDSGEIADGLMCLAAPVYNHNNRVIAAISVSGAAQRLTAYPLSAVATQVKRAAQTISRDMGYGLIRQV